MTKDTVSKVIYKYYNVLGNALRTAVNLNKDDITILISKKEIMELRSITILAYYYITREELDTNVT